MTLKSFKKLQSIFFGSLIFFFFLGMKPPTELEKETQKPFKCFKCGRAYKKEKEMRAHFLNDCGDYERRFQCPQCDKRFQKKCHVTRHLVGVHKFDPSHFEAGIIILTFCFKSDIKEFNKIDLILCLYLPYYW